MTYVRVERSRFEGFLREQADEAENANYHDMCSSLHTWADAVSEGKLDPPPVGLHGFLGGTKTEDLAFFIIEVVE